jgi:hypothetical protein
VQPAAARSIKRMTGYFMALHSASSLGITRFLVIPEGEVQAK